MKNILVTGGAGFIGSHTCLVLLENGYNVFVIDSLCNSYQSALERVLDIRKTKSCENDNLLEFFKGDLCEKIFLEKVFSYIFDKEKKIDGVIHFAGLKSVSESILNPTLYWRNNVLSTINLLEVMNKFNCKKIVFSSSATIYGNTENKLIKESDLINPINPYGNTKVTIEKILYDLYKSNQREWAIVNLRYFNPIGAHVSGNIGEAPKSNLNNIFPLLCRVASKEIKSLNIFGKDWPTFDGTPIRDYVHVMDIADGHLKALEYINKKENQKEFINLNLGTGMGTSVLELIKTFESVNKIKVDFQFKERRKGDAAFVCADIKLAKLIINWRPKRSIRDMCRDGWNWQLKNPKGYE